MEMNLFLASGSLIQHHESVKSRLHKDPSSFFLYASELLHFIDGLHKNDTFTSVDSSTWAVVL